MKPSKCILLVSLQPESLAVLEEAIQDLPTRFIMAASGQEALARLHEEDIALVLLDTRLPTLDAFETARLIQARRGADSLPILFIFTDGCGQKEIEQGYEAGGVDFITPPLHPRMVRNKLKLFCDLHQQRQGLEEEIRRRQEAEATLEENEFKYRMLVELSPLGLFAQVQGEIVQVNTAFLTLLGVDSREAIQRTDFQNMLPPDCRERFENVVNKLLNQPGPEDLKDMRLLRRDGSVLDIELNLRPVMIEHRLAIQGIVQDVTEKKRSEAAQLRERTLFVGGPVIVYRARAEEGLPVEYVSQNIAQFGYRPEDFTSGRIPLIEIIHPEDRDRATREFLAHLNEGKTSFEQDFRILKADGETRWVYYFTVVVRGESGGPAHFDGYLVDITVREKTAQALEESEERYRTLIEFSSDFIYWQQADGRMKYVSPACAELTGYPPEAFFERSALLDDLVHPDDQHLWRGHREAAFLGKGALPIDFRIVTRSGQVRWVNHTCRPVYDAQGVFQGIRASDRDITQLKEMEEALRRMTVTDGLTGVANRRFFDDELKKEWQRAKRYSLPISLIMIDIDLFKSFNDFYGHQQGDLCLKIVAGKLQESVRRPRELLARYGGEEFAAILLQTSPEDSIRVAERMRLEIESLAIRHPHSPAGRLTISLGVATLVPGTNASPSSLVDRADEALYLAKSRGRNRVEVTQGQAQGSAQKAEAG
jgi:diguanylate cyclase (GGDEF)-like protein/PAS domain S-box-containing protein